MREPDFWYASPSLTSLLLAPIAAIYGAVTGARMARQGARAAVPVICVGNYHLGGAGKTPTTLRLAEMLRALGETPFVVSRGYGGSLAGPVRVSDHSAAEVGDEPKMMARHVPVIVARDRVAGAELARGEGASVVLLDDGFQNPALEKDASVVVIDAARGLGNGRVFPAGPLRAPLAGQIARTNALIVIGEGNAANDVAQGVVQRGGLVLRASFVPDESVVVRLRNKRVLAFAGIGDPARFFATLRAHGIEVVSQRAFADHHPFTADDIDALTREAGADALTLVTTEKDLARLEGDPALAAYAARIVPFPVTLRIEDEGALEDFLKERLRRARQARQ
ncbi:tetraacyldisaccharide 4'-kinase [[Pseudomonas] carboxydohydrogena]|uniref:Tetraacyldisaccharide 4'-kinase n=1 Tax=Afipia carboxydohydrogena TaxID=290 RepID=A0ABY8BQL9_AFICR|nr:tetraacyldisaccharide 4'-kinase [[Pseudomonas] carboxydohydrogena]WEF51209.1 tetraacyldisaccharide 4'-kinase [[Pseudomonas] carboxydohydrogena]